MRGLRIESEHRELAGPVARPPWNPQDDPLPVRGEHLSDGPDQSSAPSRSALSPPG
jgi:hypothetical protein